MTACIPKGMRQKLTAAPELDQMSRAEEKREAYRAKCRAAENARRAALGLPAWPPVKAPRKPRKARRAEDAFDVLDNLDNLGESPDF